jgi:hypothetical protein
MQANAERCRKVAWLALNSREGAGQKLSKPASRTTGGTFFLRLQNNGFQNGPTERPGSR